jgi:hypothetical protein
MAALTKTLVNARLHYCHSIDRINIIEGPILRSFVYTGDGQEEPKGDEAALRFSKYRSGAHGRRRRAQ